MTLDLSKLYDSLVDMVEKPGSSFAEDLQASWNTYVFPYIVTLCTH